MLPPLLPPPLLLLLLLPTLQLLMQGLSKRPPLGLQ